MRIMPPHCIIPQTIRLPVPFGHAVLCCACNILIFNVLQKAVFCIVKGNLLAPQRRHIAMQKDAFCILTVFCLLRHCSFMVL